MIWLSLLLISFVYSDHVCSPFCAPDCRGTGCSDQTYTCAEDSSCYFNCSDEHSCESTRIECLDGSYCEILCTGNRSCYELDIILAPTAHLNQTCTEPRSCRANQQNHQDCLLPMDWVSGGSPCKINCIQECANVDQAAWDACMVGTPAGNRTCSMVGDCLRIRGQTPGTNDTWLCACTSYFIGDHCEHYIWDEFPIQRVMLLILFSFIACLNVLFLGWVFIATITELSKKSCTQIRKRHWITKFLVCVVCAAQVFKLCHILWVMSSGKSMFIDPDSPLGYFSEVYHLTVGQVLIQIVDVLTFVSHDLLLCLPSTQIILWLELVIQIKLLQKKTPMFLNFARWAVFTSASLFVILSLVAKILVSLPRHLTFGPRAVILLESIAQKTLLTYSGLWTVITIWLIFYVWRALNQATIFYPFLRTKLTKLRTRFKWFILLSLCYLTNYGVMIYDFRVDIDVTFLHPYKAYPSTVIHLLWAVDYIVLFARSVASLLTTHTYLPSVFSSQEEVSGLNWKRNRILFCVNGALVVVCIIGSVAYLTYNKKYAQSQLIEPIFVYSTFALAFVNGSFNLVLKKFHSIATLPASIWNCVSLFFAICAAFFIIFASDNLICTEFNVVRIGDESCRVSIGWILASLSALLICLFQCFFVFSSVYTYSRKLCWGYNPEEIELNSARWLALKDHAEQSDSRLEWESEYSDLEEMSTTIEEEESSDSTDFGIDDSWVVIDEPKPPQPLDPDSTEPPQDSATNEEISQSYLSPPQSPSKRNPSPGRGYLMRPGFHKKVQIPPALGEEEPPPPTAPTGATATTTPIVPNLEMSQMKKPESEPVPRRANRTTLSPRSPRKSDSPRRSNESQTSKRKTLALSGRDHREVKRRSWSESPDTTKTHANRPTKSDQYATDQLRKSRNTHTLEDEGENPRRKLVTSGKYGPHKKGFWEELDEAVDFQRQSTSGSNMTLTESLNNFNLLMDQGF